MKLIPSLVPGVDINLDILLPSERKKAMLGELSRLDEEWKKKTEVKIPEVVTYERKEEKVIDEDAIRDSVVAERTPEYQKKVAELTNKSQVSQDKKSDEIEKAKSNLLVEEGNINDKYQKDKKDLGHDMLDKGLARSSIRAGAEDRLKSEMNEEVESARQLSQTKISKIEMEIELLKAQLSSDIENFNISEGVKVQEKIDEAIKKLNVENEKIKEYNDKLAQKEAEAEEKRTEAMLKAEEARVKEAEQDALYGYQGEKAENYAKRLNIAKKYYGSISKEKALEEIKEDVDVKNYLGLYYNKLLSYIYQR